MKRRLLPILMTLVLVCALPIWAAFVTSGDVTNPLVETAEATTPPEPVEVCTADELQSNITAGKSVKLMADINITSTLKISRSLTLDLNGYVLKMGGTGRVIHIIKYHEYDVKVEIKDGEPGKEHTGEYAALPVGGVITGGNACVGNDDTGGGILLDGGSTLKLTGGCITGCHASYGGGGIRSFGELYMSGTAKIEKCTSNGGSDDAIWNAGGNIYAAGGTVDGMVNNQGAIKHSNGVTAVTVFNGTVYNRAGKSIEAGIYNGTVENNGSIIGGTFCGGVTIRKGSWGWESTGSIIGGTFYGSIVNEAGPEQVTGGTFAVRFDTDGGSEIEPTMVEYDDLVPKPVAPTKSGYTFTGWEDANGAGAYDFNTPVTAPLTLTAKWEKNPSSGGYYYYQPTTDTKTTDTKGSPKTADPGAALYGALALLSLTGMVALNGKKR